MQDQNTIITGYSNPDIDGVACSFAYAELLSKKEIQAIPVVFGIPHIEARFVIKKFNIPKFQNGKDVINKKTKVILVDHTDPKDIAKEIDPKQVIEIVDHRKADQLDKFPNAKLQIELVGSAATLIVERFKKENIKPSKESASLIYSAIISNTVNLKANLTTDRDKKMAQWVKEIAQIPDGYIDEMFMSKSIIKGPLIDFVTEDLKHGHFGTKKYSVPQLEIINADEFINNRLQEVKDVLLQIIKKYNLEYTFLTCIDVKEAFNYFVVVDLETQEILEKALDIKFENGVAKRKGIIMRKQLIPLIKSTLNYE